MQTALYALAMELEKLLVNNKRYNVITNVTNNENEL